MKIIYIFLLVTVGFFVKAQQSDLINNTWILEKLILDNTEYLFPTLPVEGNLPHPKGRIIFYNNYFSTSICNGMGGDISYTESNITITASGLTLGGCPVGYYDYEGLYFGSFFGGTVGNGTYYSSYNYSIDNVDNKKVLALVNPQGDKAFYRSSGNMAVIEVSSKIISLYPNPVKVNFTIDTNNKIEQVEIYSINGQLLKAVKSKKINISDLPKGNYLVKIKTDREIITQKIIKE